MSDHQIKISVKTEAEGGGLGIDLICTDPKVCSSVIDGTETCVTQVVWRNAGTELLVSDEGSIVATISVDAEWSGKGEDSELWLVVDEG